MFGDSSAGSKSAGLPFYPTFLLPSFTIPFRRRRPSSPVASPPDRVPSLSSSPASILSSPASSWTTTASFPDLGSSPPTSAIDATSAGRLARAQPDTLRCASCAADLAFASQIVSKGFTGRHGRAYLVSPPPPPSSPPAGSGAGEAQELANVRVGRPESRQLVTGQHVVADIACAVCSAKLGWKYVDAREAAQRYKVGKFILETARVVACRGWEDGGWPDREENDDAVDSQNGSKIRRSGVVEGNEVDDGEHEGKGENDEEDIIFDSDDDDECEDIFSGTWDPAVVARRRKGKVANMHKRGGALAT